MLWPWQPNLLRSYGLDMLDSVASQGCCSIPEDKAEEGESEAETAAEEDEHDEEEEVAPEVEETD